MSEDINLVTLTADIVSAHVANNFVASTEVSDLISTVYGALSGLGAPEPEAPERPEGVVSARKSLANPVHILSMIDGKPYKYLRRHISQHGYTPETYREAFGLAADYPMVARDYAEQRRMVAHKIGLGRKRKTKEVAPVAPPSRSPEAATDISPAPPTKVARRMLKPIFNKAAETQGETSA